MSFLKKILKKVNNSNTNKGFNLKKYARNKLAWMEEEELGAGLTPLEQFETPVMPTEGQVPPEVSMAMEKYIDQNANVPQISPMPSEWIEDISLRINFQTLAGNMLGNMADSFVANAFEATNIAKEAPTAQPPQEEQAETWQSLGDFDVDLVQAFLGSPNIERTLGSIASSIMQSGYRRGIDRDTAEEVALEAVRVALGPPESKMKGGVRRDQRFNYFLTNSDKMPVDVAQDFYAKTTGAKTDDAIAFLKDNYGDILMQALHEQVMNDDPSVKQWVLKNSGNVGKEVIDKPLGTSLTGGEERGTHLQDTDIAKLQEERVIQQGQDVRLTEDQKQLLQTQATELFAQRYLGGITKDMESVLSQAIENSYNKFGGKKAYSVERMNMFNRMLIDQYRDLLNSKGQIDAQGDMVFANDDGRVIVPSATVEDIFAGKIEEKPEKLYEEIAKLRKEGNPKFDVMDWFKRQGQSILTHSALQKEYKKELDLKNRIRDLAKRGHSEASIANIALTSAGGQGDASTQELVEALNRSSNVVEGLEPEERARRIQRYIHMALDPIGDEYLKQLGIYAGFKMKGKDRDLGAKKSMKPFAQHDSRYLMEGLQDVKQDQSKKYPSDIFQAFMGSLNPHKKVRQDYFPQIYKDLIGSNDEEYQEDTSMLNEPQRNEFLKLEKAKKNYEDSLARKENTINAEKSKAEKKAVSHHNRIQREYDKYLKTLKSQGLNPITLGEYVGVPNWNGKEILSHEDYIRLVKDRGLRIGKLVDALWGAPGKEYPYKTMPHMKKIEDLENAPVRYVPHAKKGQVPARIDNQSASYIREQLDAINATIDQFKADNNMTESQYNMASSVCQGYLKKMARIDSLQSRYQQMKMASAMLDLDILVIGIEKKFIEDFDNIFK